MTQEQQQQHAAAVEHIIGALAEARRAWRDVGEQKHQRAAIEARCCRSTTAAIYRAATDISSATVPVLDRWARIDASAAAVVDETLDAADRREAWQNQGERPIRHDDGERAYDSARTTMAQLCREAVRALLGRDATAVLPVGVALAKVVETREPVFDSARLSAHPTDARLLIYRKLTGRELLDRCVAGGWAPDELARRLRGATPEEREAVMADWYDLHRQFWDGWTSKAALRQAEREQAAMERAAEAAGKERAA